MGILQEVELQTRWLNVIIKANNSGCNKKQIDVLKRMEKFEFSRASGMQLDEHTVWNTVVDRDGDVVISFIGAFDQPAPTGQWSRLEDVARVNVYIDHLGVVSVHNLNTKEMQIVEPGAALPLPLFKPIVRSGLRTVAEDNEFGDVVESTTGRIFSPTYTGLRRLSGYDRGYTRFDGELVTYELEYIDPVTRERVYALRLRSFADRLALLETYVKGLFKRGTEYPEPPIADRKLIGYAHGLL